MLGKIDELKRRTIDVLEKTKKEKTKYAEERKKIMDFYSKRKMIFITQVALTQDLRNCVRMQI